MNGERMYTPKEAAAVIGVSDQTIYRYIERGIFQDVDVKPKGFRKVYRIPAREVERVRALVNQGNSYGLSLTA